MRNSKEIAPTFEEEKKSEKMMNKQEKGLDCIERKWFSRKRKSKYKQLSVVRACVLVTIATLGV